MDYELHYAWPITEAGLDMTLDALIVEAMEPGGALDEALFDQHVDLAGSTRWRIDSERPDGPALVLEVAVQLWSTLRDPAPLGHPMVQADAA
ncbi:hypothetical protein [Promicromonospora iranensis]|uniref:Uncharacterized protein n=1 Tax=Promicromonospora iranensis TaxID=1105144 RepID=A0ABU2CV69_9MICO|nr:hypothetical protein [Promicromonospora iranensis]MDR7385236.1 hypothetical protein [Promicromonospora iranensis]